MIKRKFSKLGELGSMMVEALAMLGLISMVTPIVYKKAAERNTELQDVNAASQMRNLIKAVDDYLLDNYGTILDNGTVKTNCNSGFDSVSYGSGNWGNDPSTGQFIDIDIRHLCEYLPYGFLNADGDQISQNKIFDNTKYRVAIKRVDTSTAGVNQDELNKMTLTGFVSATPNNMGQDFPRLRASRISSMIGGNGGFVENNQALGVQGMWSVGDISSELGITVENGSIMAASVAPITTGGSNDDAVLYRKRQANRKLNTMETTLLMGEEPGKGNNITNINQLVVTAVNDNNDKWEDNTVDKEKALWIKNKAGAFIDGILAVSTNDDGNPQFKVGEKGEMYAANQKFSIDENGAFKAAITAGANPGDPSVANFEVDKEGSFTSKKDGLVEGMMKSKRAVVGTFNDDYTAETGYELTVNDNMFVRGLLTVNKFKANEIDAGKLRAGITPTQLLEDPGTDSNYALVVTKDDLQFGATTDGKRRVTIAGATGNTTIEGETTINNNTTVNKGNFLVAKDAGGVELLKVDQSDDYTYIRGVRAGQVSGNDYPLEVTNDAEGNVLMNLRQSGSYILGKDTQKATMFEFDNDHSLIQKKVGGDYSSVDLKSDVGTFTTEVAGVKSFIEVEKDKITMDVTSSDTIEDNFILSKNAGRTAYADLALRNSSSVKVFGDTGGSKKAPVLYVDPEGEDKDNVSDRASVELSRGGVYIRRGVVDLETNNEGSYVAPQFADGNVDMGYVRADMLLSRGVNNALDANKQHVNGATAADVQYDAYMVNPAYTSVMHDIKLTSRGGARLSDILPDFINKGIYLADNTYKETLGDWTSFNYSITGGKVVPNKSGIESTYNCTSGSNIYDCPTSPWLGVVPAPQCPPGYDKVVQVFPYGFNVAQAGVPGAKRDEFYIYTDPAEQYPDPETEMDPYGIYFQKNTWLRTRVLYANDNSGTFLGWYVLMGYVYPVDLWREARDSSPDYNVSVADGIGYYWNLFPVLYRELEAYSNVYCYFRRTNFDSNYVDLDYDQLNGFRDPYVKPSGISAIDRLDDPMLKYKNPW